MAVVGIVGAPSRVRIVNVRGKMGAGGGMKSDSGIVIEDGCGCDIQNLGGRMVFMLMRAGILVGEVVAVVVGVMVVVAVGTISLSEKIVFVIDGGKVFRGGFWACGG